MTSTSAGFLHIFSPVLQRDLIAWSSLAWSSSYSPSIRAFHRLRQLYVQCRMCIGGLRTHEIPTTNLSRW